MHELGKLELYFVVKYGKEFPKIVGELRADYRVVTKKLSTNLLEAPSQLVGARRMSLSSSTEESTYSPSK
ncbi:hypothetical protein GOP47_0013156 [Adiantum capillus-veneris]|uniref:Uncharacterized protein n=1 Tax=Adiantum capillus-veneris TaxID=13818 RepID=A0A9D4UMZ1_ADICA|nr:hypothetical protein GOP47_0013156 [Adiantum capillus-veneris]